MKYITLIIVFTIMAVSCQKETKKRPESTYHSTETTESESAVTKTDTLFWYNELCSIISTYETSKYTKKQLRDTHKLWFGTGGYINFNSYPVFNLDEKLMALEDFENNYAKAKKHLEDLEVVDVPYWQNIKSLKLQELTMQYNFEITAYNAYQNPKLLKNTQYEPKAKVYVDALVSGDSLKMVQAWRILTDEQKTKNGDPDYIERKFQQRLNSSDCLAYAKMDLFSFGWNNHAIRTKPEFEVLNRNDLLEAEYKKLFINSKEECDEP